MGNYTTDDPMDNIENSSLKLQEGVINLTNSIWTVNYSTPVEEEEDSNEMILNITLQSPIDYALPIYGYIMPFLLVVTIIANTLIVVVLSKRHMRTPTNLVLMAMALSDMFTLLFPAPWLFYMYTLGNHYKPVYPLVACYSYVYMHEVLPNLFHTASIWLTLALAVQRYIYVCLPAVARTWCTIARVKKAILWIYIFAVLHQSTQFADNYFKETQIQWNNSTVWTCKQSISAWVREILTPNVYYNIYFWFRIIFVHMGPCTMLVVLNVLLFIAMKEAQQKRERLFKENKKSECKKLRDSNCTTLMLIAVVTAFLAVEIPLAVITLLHVVAQTLKISIMDYDVANMLVLFTNFFISLSYPINFAIYCGMSRQFRETFKELFIGTTSVTNREGSSRYSLVNGPRTCTNETVL